MFSKSAQYYDEIYVSIDKTTLLKQTRLTRSFGPTEIHELGLFTHKEYRDAFKVTDLDVTHASKGLDGRGLYIGQKSI